MPEPRTTETVRSSPDDTVPDTAARPGEAAAARRGTLGTVLRAVESRTFKLLFVLAMAGLGCYAVVDQWTDFSRGIHRLGVPAALEALVFVLLSLVLTLEAWRGLLTAAGSKLPARASARIFFIGQLGKYVPGSVWPVLAQMELGRTYKVPRQRSATTAMLAMVIGLASGLLATLVGLPFMAGDSARTYWWVFLFIPPLLVCLHPKVLNPAIGRALRLMRKPEPEKPLTVRVIGTAILVNVGAWSCYGLQLWVMLARLGHHGAATLLAAIGAYALAWCVGFLIVLAPAGAGIRELILVAELTPLLGGGTVAAADALAIALVSRGVTIIGDLGGAGLAALLGRGTAAPSPVLGELEGD